MPAGAPAVDQRVELEQAPDVQIRQRGRVEDLVQVGQEGVLLVDHDGALEPAAVHVGPAVAGPVRQLGRPPAGEESQQPVGLLLQASSPPVPVGEGGLALEADERGPLRLAVLLQPVGQHQPGGVVVRVLAHRPQ